MAVVSFAALSVVGCGSDSDVTGGAQASADEAAVCDQVQNLVDTIVDDEAEGAMRALDTLERSVGSTSNERLRANGVEFFATINGTVPDPQGLTADESSAVGDDALARAQPRLDALLAECDELGLGVVRLPDPEADR